jgi:hypothetical protein
MPKFLAGRHYNEEEISQHLEKNVGYWPVQMNGNKFATGQILRKTGRSCEGADFSWLSSKFSRTPVGLNWFICNKQSVLPVNCSSTMIWENRQLVTDELVECEK